MCVDVRGEKMSVGPPQSLTLRKITLKLFLASLAKLESALLGIFNLRHRKALTRVGGQRLAGPKTKTLLGFSLQFMIVERKAVAKRTLDHKSQNLKKMITQNTKPASTMKKGSSSAKYFYFCLCVLSVFLIKVKTITFILTKGRSSTRHRSHIYIFFPDQKVRRKSALNECYTLSICQR